MKFLLTGDWHLDRLTAGYDRYDDIRSAIDMTIDAAKKHAVDAYVFLGDLTNPNNVRAYRAVCTAIEVAAVLRAMDIESLWIQGNHDVVEDGNVAANGDPFSTLSPLKAAGFRVAIRPDIEACFDIPIITLPYPSSNYLYDPRSAIEGCRKLIKRDQPVLIIGHLSMPGAKLGSESVEMARGRSIEWPVDAIRANFQNAVMVGGHYHKQHVCNGVAFAGSLARLGFDEETNLPGYLTLEI